ncbi:MAG TPA: GGDEF domain-containing protein, partial [Abditibacteriaceae bacterium]
MNYERDKYSGLHGRVYGLAQLEQALGEAKQQGKTAAILFTDFDRYKSWNDKHGHSHGDVMLRQLANVVEGVVGNKGTAARIGGDEFLIVLPSASLAEAKDVAEQISKQVSQQKIDVEGQDIQSVTMTIGIALYPANGHD